MTSRIERDYNFYRWQNNTILSLMAKIEDVKKKCFHEISKGIDDDIQLLLDDQSKYKKRAKMILFLEGVYQNALNRVK